MLRSNWLMRLGLVIAAGTLLVTSTTVAVAPRLWRIANAHAEIPVELPDWGALAARSYAYDAAGNEIATFQVENSQPIALGDVPDHVIAAFLAIEDAEFYAHHGVNVRGLFRATLSNFATTAQTQGASTITMQVVKNNYMAGFERDGRYKLLQMTYAVRLEKHRTKAEILERYLNTVFFGQNSYGLGAAAETYFGKLPQELTFVEAAFLAGLVQAPSTYDPINNPERSRNRFIQVLDRLVDAGLLTADERIAEEDAFVLPERVKRRAERTAEPTYYSEALRDYLLNRTNILGNTYQERYVRLYRGGLRIHTTLDPDVQAQAELARNELPNNGPGIDAALTSIETRTGAIRAMVGGRGFVPGQNEVNLALAPSQTGSSIKLFVLAAALQAGATPNDVIDGRRGCTLPNPSDPGNPTFTIKGGIEGGVWTLREHTVRSVNCAYSRLAQMVGLNRMVDAVYRMASNPYLYRGQPVEERSPIWPHGSFSIGGNEMSTLDMAAGIQTIANEGVHISPYYVEYIDDDAGNRVYTHSDPGSRVLDREVALTAIDIMRGVLTGGTARSELAEFADERPSFGKTGTQEKNYTAFFVGATPYLSTAVLVRDPDDYTEMAGIDAFQAVGVDRVQGGTFPARIWGKFMSNVGVERAFFDGDWPDPEPPARRAARLYLPGNECVYTIVGYEPVVTATTLTPTATTTLAPAAPQGFVLPAAVPAPTQPPPAPTQPPSPSPTTTVAGEPTLGRPILRRDTTGTTIDPNVLDPLAPLPSLPSNQIVQPC